VFEVLDLPPMIADRPGAVPVPGGTTPPRPPVGEPVPGPTTPPRPSVGEPVTGPASVRFEHVSFSYPTAEQVSLASLEAIATAEQRPTAEVLHDVSFSVPPGRTVALVGRSGGGKTTITHLIARLYDVTEGAVLMSGVDVRDLQLASLRRAVGYVTQDAHMFHDTIRANLVYARPGLTDAELWEALGAAQIRDLVEGLPEGLDTVVGERGYRLSGGERQRLAIARLLLKAPPIVVLDEATAHLDSESEVAVQRALDTAMEGRTSIVIAHRLSTVRNADTIVVVDRGRIVQQGRHPELLARGGLYAELYRTQFAETADARDTAGARSGR